MHYTTKCAINEEGGVALRKLGRGEVKKLLKTRTAGEATGRK